MENIKDLIAELTERNYILGMQGEPPLYMPLPGNNEIVKHVIAINETFALAYKAGQNGEPYKLPFSDKYITDDANATYSGNIEKSLH